MISNLVTVPADQQPASASYRAAI